MNLFKVIFVHYIGGMPYRVRAIVKAQTEKEAEAKVSKSYPTSGIEVICQSADEDIMVIHSTYIGS